MSLIVCSNQDSDKLAVTTKQSVFKPYSFRNALSSTITLPKDAQIALQSCKINLDGTFSLSGNSYVLYQYYGEDLVNGSDTIDNQSTSVPIRTQIIESTNDEVQELTAVMLASRLQSAVEEYIYHPNLQYKVNCSAKYDPTSGEFEGFELQYDQYVAATNTIPDDDEFVDFGRPDVRRESADEQVWSYSSGVWTTGNPEGGLNYLDSPQVAISSGLPLSAYNGEYIVDFSDANASQLNWGVGLSRFMNDSKGYDETGTWAPEYYSRRRSAEFGQNLFEEYGFFFDYMVGRQGDFIVLYHTVMDTSIPGSREKRLFQKQVAYEDSVNTAFSGAPYNASTNASSFTKVKYTLIGQQLKIELLDASDNASVLYSYNASDDNANMVKPICQSTWDLHPVLYCEADSTNNGNTLTIETFQGCQNLKDKLPNWTALDPTSSWWGDLEGENENIPWALESRPWNDDNVANRFEYVTYAGIRTGAHPTIDWENYLILKPSELFKPSFGANTTKLLGSDETPTKNYTFPGTGAADKYKRLFTSDQVPKLLSAKSLFVRLENFTNQSVNARQGNRSSIISHLPRFGDSNVETGRIFYEPNTLIYLDLNNSEPLHVNSFDISFCYSNEQYATSLTGQSVVVLHIREKLK